MSGLAIGMTAGALSLRNIGIHGYFYILQILCSTTGRHHLKPALAVGCTDPGQAKATILHRNMADFLKQALRFRKAHNRLIGFTQGEIQSIGPFDFRFIVFTATDIGMGSQHPQRLTVFGACHKLPSIVQPQPVPILVLHAKFHIIVIHLTAKMPSQCRFCEGQVIGVGQKFPGFDSGGLKLL